MPRDAKLSKTTANGITYFGVRGLAGSGSTSATSRKSLARKLKSVPCASYNRSGKAKNLYLDSSRFPAY